jgi:anti-sigma factor RsiW
LLQKMDHNQAIQIGAAEKYVLRELSDDLRAAYEEHFFDCTACAADVQAALIFAETAREVFEQEEPHPATEARKQSESLWSPWLRPIIALPVFAALLLLVGYQNLVTIPRAKHEGAQAEQTGMAQIGMAPTRAVQTGVAEAFASSFRLLGSTRGQAATTVVAVHARDAFALDFDFTPTLTFTSYSGALVDDAGRPVLQVALPGDLANKEVHVMVPGGLLRQGRYALIINGVSAAPSSPESNKQVARLAFAVEILP